MKNHYFSVILHESQAAAADVRHVHVPQLRRNGEAIPVHSAQVGEDPDDLTRAKE